jgi:hypothetical protein
MFDIVKRAGLLPNEFAKLASVNRVTASLWFNGRNEPHLLIRSKVQKLILAIHAGLDANDFPIKEDTLRSDRYEAIKKIVTKHLRNMKDEKATRPGALAS